MKPIGPGIHYSLTMDQYLAMPAVSASLLNTILTRCPQAAWFESWLNPQRIIDSSTKAQNTGTIAHSILLEGNASIVRVIDPADFPTASSGNIPIGWTNKSIQAARDLAIADGKIPVLIGQMANITAMTLAAQNFIASLKDSEPAIWRAFQSGAGDSEATFVWEEDGVLCRIRPDRISKDCRVIIDYKTTETSVEPGSWGRRQMIGAGYYKGAAFYRRGIATICDVQPDYVFLAQEQEPPFLCSLVGMDPEEFLVGGEKIQHALTLWKHCTTTGQWPAYPNRVCYPEMPPWEATQWEAQKVEMSEGIPYDPGKLYGRNERTK